MGTPPNLFQLNFDAEAREILAKKFGTTDKKEICALIRELALTANTDPNLAQRLQLAKVRIAEATADIKEGQAKQWKTTSPNTSEPTTTPSYPTAKPQTRIRPPTPQKMLQDDLTLRCVTCGKVFPRRAYDFEQANDYLYHVKNIHGRDLYEGERKVCAELANH